MSKNDVQNNKRLDALSSVGRVSLADEPKASGLRMFPLMLLVVFFAALLLALIAGVQVYRSISAIQVNNSTRREGLELITNLVRANDETSSIATGQGPEGRALVVVENLDSGTYETRIYLYDGKIVQEYSQAGTQYTPAKASEVCESSSFDFSYSHGLLSVTTDQGAAEVALRNIKGGE